MEGVQVGLLDAIVRLRGRLLATAQGMGSTTCEQHGTVGGVRCVACRCTRRPGRSVLLGSGGRRGAARVRVLLRSCCGSVRHLNNAQTVGETTKCAPGSPGLLRRSCMRSQSAKTPRREARGQMRAKKLNPPAQRSARPKKNLQRLRSAALIFQVFGCDSGRQNTTTINCA